MTDENHKQHNNDDIEKCRREIQKANGDSPSDQTPAADDQGEKVNKDTPSKPLIPSYEDIVASDSAKDDDPFHINDALDMDDDEVDVNEIRKILSDTGPVDIDNVFEDEQKFDLLDDSEDTKFDDTTELLDDTDWQMLNEPSDNLEDVPMDSIDDESLEMMVNIDDDGPLISKQEQDLLMEELNSQDDLNQTQNDQDTNDNLVEQIQKGLADFTNQNNPDPQPQNTDDKEENSNIPEFDVYENILSKQRRQSSTKRQGPQRKAPKSHDKPAGTVGDIIKQTKADVTDKTAPSEKQPEPIENKEVVKAEAKDTRPDSSGVTEYYYKMSETQHKIVEDIVKRDIDALCV